MAKPAVLLQIFVCSLQHTYVYMYILRTFPCSKIPNLSQPHRSTHIPKSIDLYNLSINLRYDHDTCENQNLMKIYQKTIMRIKLIGRVRLIKMFCIYYCTLRLVTLIEDSLIVLSLLTCLPLSYMIFYSVY